MLPIPIPDSNSYFLLPTSYFLQQTAEETVEKAKETGSSWFGWGTSQAEETKKDAATKVEQGADKVKSEAKKRQ